MALSTERVREIDAAAAKDFMTLPIGTAICVVKAAWNFYKCEKGGGKGCGDQLLKDLEKCLTG
jgi:hypothetical protein